ncbi:MULTISPECIES: type IV secretion protein Rhs [Serratia]|uniref:type IV secretion protein Rhs n=1 Tax=Serratia TaxID=613 RepID=UPI001EF68A89|nr:MULTISPECIES: type IV secretion protein Rhs [Serratia]
MLTKEQKGQQVKEGALRLMTLGEIAMARRVFGKSIVYNRVWIHCDSYLPFGLQGKHVGMSPNGEIYFREEEYLADFSKVNNYAKQHFFIHELAHVWQHQHGQWVRLRGAFSWAANYTYKLDANKTLTKYSLEQQACIVADYWLLIQYGYDAWTYGIGRFVNYTGPQNNRIRLQYEQVLAEFLRQR